MSSSRIVRRAALLCTVFAVSLTLSPLAPTGTAHADALKTSSPPTIDGAIGVGEWDLAEIEYDTGPRPCVNPGGWDLSGSKGRFLWDDSYIYGLIEGYPNTCGPGANPNGPMDAMNWEGYINANGWPAALFFDTTWGIAWPFPDLGATFSADRLVLEFIIPIALVIDNTGGCPGSPNCPQPYTFDPSGGDFFEYRIAVTDTDAAGGFDSNAETLGWIVEPPLSGYEHWRKLTFTEFVPECQIDDDCDDGFFCNGAETCDPPGLCVQSAQPCDDGVSCTTDTCNEDNDLCSNTADDAACDNGAYCDGAETCDAQTDCQSGTPPCVDGDECTTDDCDEPTDTCSYTAAPDTTPCDDGNECTSGDECLAGVCTGAGSTVAASCDWAIIGGNASRSVRVKTGTQSVIGGAVCMDTVALGYASTTNGDVVAMSASGIRGVRIGVNGEVAGDTVTGGSGVRGWPRGTLLPGLSVDEVAGGGTAVRTDGSGFGYDTTGTDARLTDCDSAQSNLDSAASDLDALPQTANLGEIRIRLGATHLIDTGAIGSPGALNVFDITRLRAGIGSTLQISGGGDPNTAVILRLSGKLVAKLRFSVQLVNGLTAENLLIYSKRKCEFGKDATGEGSVLSMSGKLGLTHGSTWSGTLLGAGRVKVGDRVVLTHVPFLGD